MLFNEASEEKVLILFVTKLIEKTPDASHAKKYLNFHFHEKMHKISKTIKNSYSATKK